MKKRFALWVVLTLCLASLPFAASAQYIPAKTSSKASESGEEGGTGKFDTSDRRFYISPMFSYDVTDHDSRLKDGYGGIISVGKRLTGGLKLELTGTYHTFDSTVDKQKPEQTGVG